MLSPRKPTDEERAALINHLITQMCVGEVTLVKEAEKRPLAVGIVERAAIAVFDAYTSRYYTGPLMVVASCFAPDITDVYVWKGGSLKKAKATFA